MKAWPWKSTVKLSGLDGGLVLAATHANVSGGPFAGRGLPGISEGAAAGPVYGLVANRQYELSVGAYPNAEPPGRERAAPGKVPTFIPWEIRDSRPAKMLGLERTALCTNEIFGQ